MRSPMRRNSRNGGLRDFLSFRAMVTPVAVQVIFYLGCLLWVAMNVGFYYMANAVGRLAGTVLSGVLYQWQGLEACLWASVLFVLAAGTLSLLLPAGVSAGRRAAGAAPSA